MNRSRGFKGIVSVAAFCLSVLSIYTTAQGFNIYVPVPWLGWVASTAVQILILMILFARLKPWAFIITVPAYFLLLLFSVGGSFLLIDEQLSLQDRRVQAARDACSKASRYIADVESYMVARSTLVKTLLSRLEDFQVDEDEIGALSGAGAGQGPMYREIKARAKSLAATRDSLSASEEALGKCRVVPSLDGFAKKPEQTGSKCAESIECGALALAQLPQDQYLSQLLQQTTKLFKGAKYEAAMPEMPISPTPDQPLLSVGASTLQQRIEGARDDLIVHPRFSTRLALALAMVLEAVLFLIALISRMQVSEQRRPETEYDEELSEVLRNVKQGGDR